MSSLLMLACLFLLPALLTWILTRLLLRSEAMQRPQALIIAVPLLPFAITVGRAGNIDNPVPIAIAATLMAGAVIALCVCLPVGLAASRGR